MKHVNRLIAALRRAATALAVALSKVMNPLRIIVASVWKLLNALAQTIAETPAGVAAALSDYISEMADHVPEQLDEKADEKRKKKRRQQSTAVLRSFFDANSLVENRKLCRCAKVFLITALQLCSLRSTYRGLAQCFTDPMIPLLLSLAVQIGVVVLCNIIGLHNTQKSKWLLVISFIAVSVIFSFVGVSERTLHYQDYIERIYEQYANEYRTVRTEAANAGLSALDPLAAIEGEYVLIDHLLEEGEAFYGGDVLDSAQRDVAAYEGKTVTQVVSRGTSLRVLPDGQTVVVDNGDTTVSVPDPAAVGPLAAAKDQVASIQAQQTRINVIKGLLVDSCALERVKEVVSRQMDSDAALPEFVSLSASISALVDSCDHLAQAVKSDIRVSLDLNGLLEEYRSAQISDQIRPIASFEDLSVRWEEEGSGLALADMEWLNLLLGTDVARVPSRLKELADQEISTSFASLSLSLSLIRDDAGIKRLEDAYAAYSVLDPFTYAVRALLDPGSSLFGGALMAAGIALFVDLMSLAVGLVMVNRPLDLTGSGAIPPTVLRKHMYESLLNTVTPILRARLKRMSITPADEDISNICAEILADFLDNFLICPQLVRIGFSRYRKGPPDGEFSGLCTLLLTLGMMEHLSHAEAVSIGLISSGVRDDGEGYLVLSSRGETWIMELLGSSDVFMLANVMT